MNLKQGIIKHLFKILFLGVIDALSVWSAIILFTDGAYLLFAALVIIVLAINIVYLVEKAYPMRYILPGTIFMVLLVVYPIFYTVYISFTNYGTGHVLDKHQVIEQLEDRHFKPENTEEFNYTAYKAPDSDKFAMIFEDSEGNIYLGIDGKVEETTLNDSRFKDPDNDNKIDKINNYNRLSQMKLFQNLSTLQELEYKMGDELLKMKNARTFALYIPQFEYRSEDDKIVNLRNDKVYKPHKGYFRTADGERLTPGFRTGVGWKNYIRLFTDEKIFKPFARVFTWTFVWATLSVFSTFALGLFMAIILNDNTLKFRKIYRVILILPYAIPGFISVLIWRGLFNPEIGVINKFLEIISLNPIAWTQDPFWAKVAVLVINLWLGYPYMMLIALGSLQSIKQNLYEAAAIDGASIWQQFRHITLPLLLVSLGPLLISSFAFNFNNFNVIYLFNEGGPAIPGTQTPAGATDILISYTYRLSFATGRGADFGLASAVTLFIFMITATITWFNFKYTGALEDVKENA